MGEEPEQPGRQAREAERAEPRRCRGRPPRPCGRWSRGCRSRRSGTVASARRQPRAGCSPRRARPICLAAGLTPGTGVACRAAVAQRRREVADDADLGMAGQAEVGLDRHAAGAVERRRRCRGASARPSGDAATPAAQMHGAARRAGARCAPPSTVDLVVDALGVDRASPCAGAHLDAEPLELAGARVCRQLRHEGCRGRAPALEQDHVRASAGRCGGTRRAACAARSRPACRPSRRRSGRRR